VTASQRRTVTVLVAALGVAFLLVWAATAGPPQLVAQQADSVVDQSGDPAPAEVDEDNADAKHDSDVSQTSPTHSIGAWVQDVTAFVLVVAGLFIASLLLRQMALGIRRKLVDERLVVPLDPLPDLEVARAAVEREHGRQQEVLAGSDVRNGIIACWVVFEEAAAESHVAKQPAETASAFVVRFLHSLDVDPRPVAELADLFLEARFSSHALSPDTRPRAERALAAIHHDLAHAGATP
jgi:Domain of unknown function (DUF4129)